MTWRRCARSARLIAVAFGVAACTAPEIQTKEAHASEEFQFSRKRHKINDQIAGKTIHLTDASHGTQVEYFAENGTAMLWYPGNRVGVPSLWKVTDHGRDTGNYSICFLYPSKSYNPVTKQHGGEWECRHVFAFSIAIAAIHPGDPYGLSGGRIPLRLPKNVSLSPEEVAQMAGKTNDLTYVWRRGKTK